MRGASIPVPLGAGCSTSRYRFQHLACWLQQKKADIVAVTKTFVAGGTRHVSSPASQHPLCCSSSKNKTSIQQTPPQPVPAKPSPQHPVATIAGSNKNKHRFQQNSMPVAAKIHAGASENTIASSNNYHRLQQKTPVVPASRCHDSSTSPSRMPSSSQLLRVPVAAFPSAECSPAHTKNGRAVLAHTADELPAAASVPASTKPVGAFLCWV